MSKSCEAAFSSIRTVDIGSRTADATRERVERREEERVRRERLGVDVAVADPALQRHEHLLVHLRHRRGRGALAVATLGRTLDAHGGWIMPRANVTSVMLAILLVRQSVDPFRVFLSQKNIAEPGEAPSAVASTPR